MAFNETMNDNNMNVPNDDDLDALSFCDLPMSDAVADLEPGSTSCNNNDEDRHQDMFEFSTSPEHHPENSVIFFGKSIATPAKQQPGLVVRKDSFKKCHSSRASDASSSDYSGSTSFRFGGPKAVSSPPGVGGSFHYYRSGSGGGGSKPSKMIIGLVMRLEPTMELSDMRKRQGRLTPAPMFPANSGRRAAGNRKSGNQHYWGLLRPNRCRAHIVNALSKASFGCISNA